MHQHDSKTPAAGLGSVDREEYAQDGGKRDLGHVAHELRAPLAAIQAMADALAGGHLGPVSPRHADYLAGIRETARHALALVEQLAASGPASVPAGTGDASQAPAHLALGPLAFEVAASLRLAAARAGVRLETATAMDGVSARARATDVRQMLINLVANAIAHAGTGANVVIAGGSGGGEAWLEVADDGPGVPEKVIEALAAGTPVEGRADPAFEARARLGLTITQALARANGGRLELLCGAEGTRARIVLPRAPA